MWGDPSTSEMFTDVQCSPMMSNVGILRIISNKKNLGGYVSNLAIQKIHGLPSGNLTVCYGKWSIEIFDVPMNSMLIFQFANCKRLPEGTTGGASPEFVSGLRPPYQKYSIKLVGGFNSPLWKMMDFVSWDDFSIPNFLWKVIKFHGSRPPTSIMI
jgi:hypothetical protein